MQKPRLHGLGTSFFIRFDLNYQREHVTVPDHLCGAPSEEFIQIHDVMRCKDLTGLNHQIIWFVES